MVSDALRGTAARMLGPVGGRIMAEVLVDLIGGDLTSHLVRRPRWRPT